MTGFDALSAKVVPITLCGTHLWQHSKEDQAQAQDQDKYQDQDQNQEQEQDRDKDKDQEEKQNNFHVLSKWVWT